jgi:hypothetical protein
MTVKTRGRRVSQLAPTTWTNVRRSRRPARLPEAAPPKTQTLQADEIPLYSTSYSDAIYLEEPS